MTKKEVKYTSNGIKKLFKDVLNENDILINKIQMQGLEVSNYVEGATIKKVTFSIGELDNVGLDKFKHILIDIENDYGIGVEQILLEI